MVSDYLNNSKRCVIISGSPYFCACDIYDTDYIIACDSGYRHAQNAGIVPDLVVGDFDSYCGSIDGGIEMVTAPKEKDDTDTMLGIKLGFERGYADFVLLGATGGRTDHQLANISAAAYIAEHGGRCVIYDGNNEIYLLKDGSMTLKNCEGKAVSVLSFSDTCVGVSYSGLKYPLINATLRSTFPLGVSNEICAEQATVEVRSGILLVIISSLDGEAVVR